MRMSFASYKEIKMKEVPMSGSVLLLEPGVLTSSESLTIKVF